ncbi:MAG: hypothetical protein RIC95_14290 [Vicingaceae bacterium]
MNTPLIFLAFTLLFSAYTCAQGTEDCWLTLKANGETKEVFTGQRPKPKKEDLFSKVRNVKANKADYESYPDSASVTVSFTVKADSSITAFKTLRSYPKDFKISEDHFEGIKRLINTYEFTPGICNGKPTDVPIEIPIVFKKKLKNLLQQKL